MGENEATVEWAMTAEQLEDFTWLLANHRTLGDIQMLAQRILGEKTAVNDLDNKTLVASETVKKLQQTGLLRNAIELLLRESHPSGSMVVGLRDILRGNRLNSGAALQSLLNRYEPFLSSAGMIELLPKVARRVCAVGVDINIPGVPKIKGTGFLIASDIVITNYHVVRNCLEEDKATGDYKQTVTGDKIFFFFDYLHTPTPNVPPGKENNFVAVNAAQNWYVKARPNLPNDGIDDSPDNLPNNELDYVLIRLDRPLGSLAARTGGGLIRGWLPLVDAIDTSPDKRILVVQHPETQPQLFDIGTYESTDKSGSRVWYSVSTANGSSGGAALDTEGKLFALHNASVKSKANVNQGVRIDWIAKDVKDYLPKDPAPDDDSKLLWSLNDNFEDSSPIIGRSEFREYVARMSSISSVERVLVVTGTPPEGLNYSIKLLNRLRLSDVPAAIFSPDELRNDLDQGFLQRLLAELNLIGAGSWPKKETEADARWVGAVANWLADALARDYELDKTRYPAWLVINTVESPNVKINLPLHLRELISTLLGRNNDGQTPLDVPQLRWLFLVLPGTNLPLAGISRHNEDLSENKKYKEDFEECFLNAYKSSINKEAGIPEDLLLGMADYVLEENARRDNLPPRKALAVGCQRFIATTSRNKKNERDL